MNLRRIKHTLLRLTAEEKVIGIGSIIMLIGIFLPWYNVTMSFDEQTLVESGFSGDLGVIGFVIFLMSLISLLVLVGENMHLPLPRFGYKREQILFFFLGQSFFLTLLTMAVYTKRSLEFTEAGLNFGIYIVLAGGLFGTLSAFALIQKTKRKEVQEFFSHEEEKREIGEPSEEMHFAEDKQMMDLMEEEVQHHASDDLPEDDMMEDIQEVPKSQNNQGSYLMRDAGIGKYSLNKREERSNDHLSMNFDEDK